MSLSTRHGKPTRREGLWLRQVGDENALYDPASGALHLLNDTALAIWNLCDGETDPQEMVIAICEVTGLHVDVVAEDVDRIISEFEAAHVVERVD